MARFYYPAALTPDLVVTLPANESHHLAKVLRLNPGDEVTLFDGRGTVAQATIEQAHGKHSSVRVLKVTRDEAAPKVWLAFGIAKGTALDILVAKCAELGVAGFQPLVSQHSSPAKGWNAERWEKVVHEVAKQCEGNFLPELRLPLRVDQWLAEVSGKHPFLVCDEAQRDPRPPVVTAPSALYVVTGAEGGWSNDERESFKTAGGIFLGLGRNRLRAETAAMVGLVLAKQFVGELSPL